MNGTHEKQKSGYALDAKARIRTNPKQSNEIIMDI